ncbi:TetR family transcriptional regulator (plasmid) [Rhodococcus sp. USK10]|uniref:TetR/AcrR family transcriptional regulator n=1 Tax=Rhodococcus sp. USK10 TaxID=2789739 RepID=UPI001C5FC34A|nr:TetR family transcriptional regulator [Rhodococcus sp. USK10]
MTAPSTRETVVAAARDLFARRGYTATTIKDIATAAGCSPALVMKLTGSKAELFAAADPSAAVLDEAGAGAVVEQPLAPEEPVGWQLVRRLVGRRDGDQPEPWAMAPIFIRESADPEATRTDMRGRYLDAIAARIGDTSSERLRTQLVLAELLGLATAMRHLDLLGPDVMDSETLIRRYGTVLQSIIDGTV